MSQIWIKKNELSENHAVLKQIQAMNEHRIFCYDSHQINVEIINHEKIRKRWKFQFHAINMRKYDMILNYSWFNEINLNIR